MAENDITFIDDIEDSVVCARREDGSIRVFYDLDDLMAQYMPHHVARSLAAATDEQKFRCLGSNDVLKSLNESLIALAMQARAQVDSAGTFDAIGDISDLFPNV